MGLRYHWYKYFCRLKLLNSVLQICKLYDLYQEKNYIVMRNLFNYINRSVDVMWTCSRECANCILGRPQNAIKGYLDWYGGLLHYFQQKERKKEEWLSFSFADAKRIAAAIAVMKQRLQYDFSLGISE